MTRFIALLRGINVGGHRVKMDALRQHFVALKFASVETFVASGNVIFETASTGAPALATRIEHHLARALGYAVPTFLRTLPELAAVVTFQPFARVDTANEAHSRYVLFLRTALDEALQRDIAQVSAATDEFRVQGREIHWLRRGRISDETPAAKAFGKLLRSARVDATSRNITMLQRLVAQLTAEPAAPARASRASRPILVDTGRAGRARTA